jgi:hypothetical protein
MAYHSLPSHRMSEMDLRTSASMWRAGFDSLEIAQRLRLRESIVWSNLSVIRRYAREGRVQAVELVK